MNDLLYQEVQAVLIEDNPDDAELTMRSLKLFNFSQNFIWLQDGAEALNFLFARDESGSRKLRYNPKLILLDLKLPKISGVEVLRKIKADQQLKMTPIVVMTSSNEQADLQTCYHLGVNSFVTKPIDYREFIEATRNISHYWLMVNQTPV